MLIVKSHTFRWLAPLPAILAMTTVSVLARATDRLEIWPTISLAEQLTDNVPVGPTTKLVPEPISSQELGQINFLRSLFGLPPLTKVPTVLVPQQTGGGSSNDAITLFNLGGSATIDSGNRTFGLDLSTQALLYAKNSGFDQGPQDNQYVGVHDYERLSSRTGLSLNDSFINGQSTFGQGLVGPSAASPLLSQGLLQNSFLTNAFNLQLNHQITELLSSTFSVHQTYFSNSSSGSSSETVQPSSTQTSESFQQGGEVSAQYAILPRFSLGPDFQLNDFRFSNQPRSDSYQPSLAVTWNRSEHLVTTGSIGPLVLSAPNSTSVGVGYSLNTTYTAERWVLNLSSGRTPSLTGGTSNASVSQYVGASAQYKVTRRTSAYLNVSFSQYTQTTNNNHIYVVGAGVNHQLTRSISLFSQFTRYESNSPVVSGSGNATDMLTLGIRFTPRPWFWTF